jgi:hypothetical protein
MSLITDELVRVVHTAIPCRRNASASQAENVLLSYCLCLVAAQAMLCAFVSIVRSGRSGRPARLRGIVTEAAEHTLTPKLPTPPLMLGALPVHRPASPVQAGCAVDYNQTASTYCHAWETACTYNLPRT